MTLGLELRLLEAIVMLGIATIITLVVLSIRKASRAQLAQKSTPETTASDELP